MKRLSLYIYKASLQAYIPRIAYSPRILSLAASDNSLGTRLHTRIPQLKGGGGGGGGQHKQYIKAMFGVLQQREGNNIKTLSVL